MARSQDQAAVRRLLEQHLVNAMGVASESIGDSTGQFKELSEL